MRASWVGSLVVGALLVRGLAEGRPVVGRVGALVVLLTVVLLLRFGLQVEVGRVVVEGEARLGEAEVVCRCSRMVVGMEGRAAAGEGSHSRSMGLVAAVVERRDSSSFG